MSEKNTKHNRRLRNLIFGFLFLAILISVSTYAWFIGMRTVYVSPFDVTISTADSLLLSLNGADWYTTLEISQADLDDLSYDGHKNTWGGDGLAPISTIGEMDYLASRLTLFEKASLTATPGGYRLMASRVDNTGENELDGYVAFDLFVKNFSGRAYYTESNIDNEEAIYLTTNSEVTVSSTGIANTGIENSVRVAFAQIGRVIGTTTDAGTITAMTCNGEEDTENGGYVAGVVGGVTGICRTARIWEPNDMDHVQNAINWYNESCLSRTGNTVAAGSYSGACKAIGSVYRPTYAVNTEIDSTMAVDVYDGEEYNGYTTSSELTQVEYFTDTMKDLAGTARPPFMMLAPNSITKVRVYVYIEGQDIDNYDFAQLGKSISVAFGFTKERFIEGDIGYPGTPGDPLYLRPTIALIGGATMQVNQGETFTDPGATATDNYDSDTINSKIQVVGTVNTGVLGTYELIYRVENSLGFTEEVTRTVNVIPAVVTP